MHRGERTPLLTSRVSDEHDLNVGEGRGDGRTA
jgi:hypothetical protein